METEISLSSKRLVLRPLRPTDANSLYAYRRDETANAFQSWIPTSIEDARERIRENSALKINVPNTWYQLAIIEKATQKMIGDIGIHFLANNKHEVEYGITLAASAQGKGYATEALKTVFDYIFQHLNKRRITASIDPQNAASLALSERLGMRKEAHFVQSLWFKGQWVDDVIYAILKQEFENRQSEI